MLQSKILTTITQFNTTTVKYMTTQQYYLQHYILFICDDPTQLHLTKTSFAIPEHQLVEFFAGCSYSSYNADFIMPQSCICITLFLFCFSEFFVTLLLPTQLFKLKLSAEWRSSPLQQIPQGANTICSCLSKSIIALSVCIIFMKSIDKHEKFGVTIFQPPQLAIINYSVYRQSLLHAKM